MREKKYLAYPRLSKNLLAFLGWVIWNWRNFSYICSTYFDLLHTQTKYEDHNIATGIINRGRLITLLYHQQHL